MIPVAVLEVELDLQSTALRLNLKNRKYVLRTLTMQESHPICRRCPEDFSGSVNNEREESPEHCP